MGFGEAIKSFFGNYANFKGRARRSEYWFSALFLGLTILAAALLDALLGTFGVLYLLWILAIVVPSLAVTVRRLHDIDRSGAWYFINFVPLVGPIILLVFMCQDSKPGENEYGEPVK